MKKIPLIILSAFIFLPTFSKAEENMTKYQKNDQAVSKLTETQYHVTQENGTEKPFNNEYWDFWEDGIYVDVVSGEPLFSSKDKYDAGNGWPSFHKPIKEDFLVEKDDKSYGMSRTEVRSKSGDSHLGHVFNDGPKSEGGRHFCINSSSMRFIPKDKLIDEGYGEYITLFEK